MLRYGNLTEFSMKGFSTEAKFVKQKMEEVKKDANDISDMKQEIVELKNELEVKLKSVDDKAQHAKNIAHNLLGGHL